MKLNLRDESPDSKVSEFFFFGFFFNRGQAEEDIHYYSKFLQLHLRKKSWEDRPWQGKGRCCQAGEPGTVQDGTAGQNVSRSPPTNYGHIQRGEGRMTTRNTNLGFRGSTPLVELLPTV